MTSFIPPHPNTEDHNSLTKIDSWHLTLLFSDCMRIKLQLSSHQRSEQLLQAKAVQELTMNHVFAESLYFSMKLVTSLQIKLITPNIKSLF